MKKVAILGMATQDELFLARSPIDRQGTVAVEALTGPAVRCGGAPFYTGQAMAAAGLRVSPIFAVGADPAGAAIIAACEDAGLDISGIARLPGARTPRCLIILGPDGEDLCLFDDGDVAHAGLNADQESLLAEADLIIISAAPSAQIAVVIASVTNRQRLACIFKDDPACFPDTVCEALIPGLDYLFHNEREGFRLAPYLPLARPEAVIFRTLGAAGVSFTINGQTRHLPATPVTIATPIGAGDTFAGHALAALLGGTSLEEATAMAIDRTSRFLADRPA